jgi:non-ribosomal peptide synthetase component F
LPVDLAEAARRFSHEEGGTLFMALVAALKILLHRYLGQDDVRVATNVANRNRPGTEALIGPLVNTVILRTNLGGNPSPREVLRRVRETTLAAFANQDFPFEELIPDLKGERHLKPLAQANTMILLQNATLRPVAGADHGLRFEEANPNTLTPLVTVSSYDIIIMLREGRNGLVGTCVYKPHLFHAEMIDHLLSEFHDVLERMTTPERPISELDLSLNTRTSHG